MSRKIRLKRGNLADLPQLELGEPGVATDDGSLYIGTDRGNVRLANQDDLDGVNQQLADKSEELDRKKANKDYVDTQISRIGNASPKGVYPTLSDLESAFPSGDSNIYVVTEDGNWYYWSGTAWTPGGVYQSTLSDSFPATNLIKNGNFSNTNNWYAGRATLSAINNTLRIEADGSNATTSIYQVTGYSVPPNHKVYFKVRAKINDSNVDRFRLNLNDGASNYFDFNNPAIGDWRDYSAVSKLNGGNLTVYAYTRYTAIPPVGALTELQYAVALDLTAIFGEGNEPTVSEMDEILSKFPYSWFDNTISPLLNEKEIFARHDDLNRRFTTTVEEVDRLKVLESGIKPQDTTFFMHGKNLFNKDTVHHDAYISTTQGTLVSSPGYVSSDYIKVDPNTVYSVVDNQLRMAFYDKYKNFVSGIADPVSPITTPENTEYVRYSFAKGDLEIQQFEKGPSKTSYEPYSGWKLETANIKDGSIPLSKLDGVLSDGEIVDGTEIIVDMQPDKIYFYMKGSDNDNNKYLRYSFTYETRAFDGTTSNGNLNAWRLRDVFVVTRTGEWTFEDNFAESLTTSGVWEFALKEKGMGNFMGGGHGSEIMTSAFVRFDGIDKPLGTTEKFKCKEINFVQKSTIYRWLTETPVGETVKMYEIRADYGIKLTTEIRWIESVLLGEDSYLPMFPIKRLLTDGTTQITDRFYRDTDYEKKDVSTQQSVVDSGAKDLESGVTKAVIWGEESGFSAEVIVLERPKIESEKMYVTDSQLYNKFYFMLTGADYTTEVGEKWKSVVVFKMNAI